MKRIQLFILSLLVFIPLVFPSNLLAACVCGQEYHPADNANRHDHVFSGQVNRVVRRGREHVATVRVIKTYRGYQDPEVEIFTEDPDDPSNCGYRFRKGETYFIYANIDKDGKIRTDGCSQTKPLDEAEEDIAAIAVEGVRDRTNQQVEKAKEIVGIGENDTQTAVYFTAFFAASVLILILGVGVGSGYKKKKKVTVYVDDD